MILFKWFLSAYEFLKSVVILVFDVISSTNSLSVYDSNSDPIATEIVLKICYVFLCSGQWILKSKIMDWFFL
jgi:hypothetical protein